MEGFTKVMEYLTIFLFHTVLKTYPAFFFMRKKFLD